MNQLTGIRRTRPSADTPNRPVKGRVDLLLQIRRRSIRIRILPQSPSAFSASSALKREEAEVARERALCDGPPHCYKPALDEADRLLAQL